MHRCLEGLRRVTRSSVRVQSNSTTRCGALADSALIDAMRDGVPEAWFEFDARFRPLLDLYARRVGIPRWEANICVTDVLDDEALELAEGARGIPRHLSAYLMRALRHRFLEMKRASARRHRRHASAAGAQQNEGVLIGVMSEHARRASEPRCVAEETAQSASPIMRFARLLDARLTVDERQVLAWVGEAVPHRVIAEWLGISREAAKKRIARLCRRVRALGDEIGSQLAPNDRREVEHVLRRAEASRRVTRSGGTDDG